MRGALVIRINVSVPFNAGRGLMPGMFDGLHLAAYVFQYPSMRVVD